MLGLGKRLLAERPFALELGGRERGQLQSGAEREAIAAELKCAFKRRRQHQDAGGDDALLALQHARDFGGAKSAIAFAKNEFGRTGAAVLGDIKRNDLGHGFRIAVNGPKVAGVVRLGRAAPAGADRIDQHQIGERQPGIRIVDQAHFGAVAAIRPNWAMRGPTRPRLRKAEAAPGPPLKTKVTGRAAVFADFATKAV